MGNDVGALNKTVENAPIQNGAAVSPGIHLMAKPVGPACNLRCEYCFYLEKSAFFPAGETSRMSDEVLDAYIRNCVSANWNSPAGIPFTWQGGEPTLAGLDFYRKALKLERRYTQGRAFSNALQTNGTLLDDAWCEFLARNSFLVGLSLDGPESIHDRYRRDARGEPTFQSVLRGLKLLQKHGVEYNVLACVARETAKHPLEVYRFFKEQGVQFVQFSPVVERLPGERASGLGLKLDLPPSPENGSHEVTPWSVEPEALGDFYNTIFDEWVRRDVGRMFIMNFEWMLYAWLGGVGPVCYLNSKCGNCAIVEHNGDVYACDHYVYPEFKLGNILSNNAASLLTSTKQQDWGSLKERTLPEPCRQCEVGFICRGGCPKHRFARTHLDETGLNYLCAGYKKFYTHTRKYMQGMAKLVELGMPCDTIMQAIDQPVMIPAGGGNDQPVLLWIK
jgi:uncharacterized protein